MATKHNFTLKELETDKRFKLSSQQKDEILSLKGKLSVSELAKYYNVSTSTIRDIHSPERKESKRIALIKWKSNNPAAKPTAEAHNKRVAKHRYKKIAINEGLI